MAKKEKKQNSGTSHSQGYVVGAFGFLALIFYIISAILNAFKIGNIFGWLGQIFLLVTIFWCAWLWVRHQKRWLKIVYLIIVIATIVSFVFGFVWVH
jgi:Ca2+/Na+ antiporter